MLTIGFTSMMGVYMMFYTNNARALLIAQYDWGDNLIMYSLTQASCFGGVSIGAAMGGKFMQRGRRQSMVIFCCVALIGTGFIMVENIYMLLIGRVIQGIARGVTAVAASRLIEETVPLAIFGQCMALNNLF